MTASVWLHGTGLAGLRWGPQAQTGIWPTLPGHGTAPRVAPSVLAYARTLDRDLPGRVALAGHSLGGMVAMAMAADQPQKVRALIVVDAPIALPEGAPRWLGAHAAPVMARVPGPRGFAAVVARRTANRAARPAVRAAIAATPVGGLSDALTAAAGFDGHALLPRLTMPILCLLARDSFLTGDTEARAFAALPNAEVHELPCGHMIPFDAAETVDPLMARFLEAHP